MSPGGRAPAALEHAPGAETGSPIRLGGGLNPHPATTGPRAKERTGVTARPCDHPEGGYLHGADVTGHRGGDDASYRMRLPRHPRTGAPLTPT